jgi:amino acid transporter
MESVMEILYLLLAVACFVSCACLVAFAYFRIKAIKESHPQWGKRINWSIALCFIGALVLVGVICAQALPAIILAELFFLFIWAADQSDGHIPGPPWGM